MSGKFIINDNSYFQLIDINLSKIMCSFHSTLNYRILGNEDIPDALDPSGGPMIAVGVFKLLDDFILSSIRWDKENKYYILTFEKLS